MYSAFLNPFFILWDKISRSLILALRSLWLHKMRAFLSVLGIIIGTAAVISLMAIGEGSMHVALEAIKRQGATNIMVRSVKPADDSTTQKRSFVLAYGLTYADYEKFKMIDSVAKSVPMRIFPQEVRRLHYMHNGRVVGTTSDYQQVNKFTVALGRFLVDADNVDGEGDDSQMRNVCVLGADVSQTLFPFESPLGQSVVLNKNQFVVVGVLADRMPTAAVGGTSTSGEEFNSDVYIPLRTCRGRYGDKIFLRTSGSRGGEQVELHQVTLTIDADIAVKHGRDKVRAAGEIIRDMLEVSHYRKDTAVTVPLDRLEAAEETATQFTIFLAFIAGISLFVGGIGIMNIMLATVTERTREIGIRRALGAKRRDIVLQFLIEAIVQTSIGGILGVGIGLIFIVAAPPLAALFHSPLPTKLHAVSIFLALGVSILVGVAFGLYPAWRASRLDPIEALRHE